MVRALFFLLLQNMQSSEPAQLRTLWGIGEGGGPRDGACLVFPREAVPCIWLVSY